jgi:hypothetical protein
MGALEVESEKLKRENGKRNTQVELNEPQSIKRPSSRRRRMLEEMSTAPTKN